MQNAHRRLWRCALFLCMILIDISPKSDYNIQYESDFGQYPTGSDIFETEFGGGKLS